MKISEATFNELKKTFDKAIQEAFGAGVKEGREGAQSTVDEPETKFKTVNRDAEIGERILIVDAFTMSIAYSNGDIMTVEKHEVGHVTVKEVDIVIYHDEYVVIIEDDETIEHEGLLLRKVEREASEDDYIRPTVNSSSEFLLTGRIYGPVDNLNQVKSEGLNFWVYENQYDRTKETVEVFEVIESDSVIELQDDPTIEPVPITPNQQRSELTQWARELVENYLNAEGLVINHDYYENPTISFFRKDNKTTCVITPENTMLDRFVGRSFCSKGDVFNEWIGKAIALARALEIEIPQEFLDAIQPTKLVVGMKVERFRNVGGRAGELINTLTIFNVSETKGHRFHTHLVNYDSGYDEKDGDRITDDTNAEYNA